MCGLRSKTPAKGSRYPSQKLRVGCITCHRVRSAITMEGSTFIPYLAQFRMYSSESSCVMVKMWMCR